MAFPESSIIPEGVRVQSDQKHINDVRRDAFNNPALIGGRLSLSSSNPVPTGNINGAGTLFYTPYLHDRVPVWDGLRWESRVFTQRSLSLAALVAGTNYDVFLSAPGGLLTLSTIAWSGAKTRATGLAWAQGLYTSASDPSLLFLGTIYMRDNGTTSDDEAWRFVSNYYNRVPRPLGGYTTGDVSGTITGASNQELHTNFRVHWTACRDDVFMSLNWQGSYYESNHWTSRTFYVRGTDDVTVLGRRSVIGDVDATAEHGGPLTVHYAGYPGQGWEYVKLVGASGGAYKWRAFSNVGNTGWIMG